MYLSDFRKEYHMNICKSIIRIRKDKTKEYPNFADSGNNARVIYLLIFQYEIR